MEVPQLAARLDRLAPGRRVLVAVDGPDAAGKTTLADRLAGEVRRPVVRASVDGWHRTRAERYRRGRDSAEGCYLDTYDYPALVSRLLQPFAAGESSLPTAAFDRLADTAGELWATDVAPNALLLVDGVFLQRPELREHWDLVVYLDVPDEVVLDRAVRRDAATARDADELVRRYRTRYLPAQALYRAAADPLTGADVVVSHRSGNDSTA